MSKDNKAKNQTRKFFIYARKSTDSEDRQVRSIGDQISELQELAKKENLEIVDTIVEKQTAKKPERPMFADMLKRMEAGEAEGILAWHPDRLARNSVDGGQIIYLVDTGVIKELKFPTFWFDPTPQGKFMLSIAFGQSKYYVDNLSENIKRGHRQKLKQGLWPQMAPLGYLNDKKTKMIYLDKEKAPLIKKAFEAYATGKYTLRELRKIINGLGLRGRRGKMLSVSNYQYMLKNPIYYGVIRCNGEIYEGKHEPIITKKLFDKVQKVLSERSRPKTKKLKPYIYRGLFRCGECGCFITTETQKGHNYLRCTKRKTRCSQRYTREEIISGQIKEKIQKVSLCSTWAEKCIAELEKEKQEQAQAESPFAQKLRGELVEIERKLDRLLDLQLSGAITQNEYSAKKQKILNQKIEVSEKLRDFERKGYSRFEPMINFIKATSQAKNIALHGNLFEQKDFLKKIGSNFRISERTLAFDLKMPWKIAEKYNAEARSAEATPSKIAESAIWRRDWDSNPGYAFTYNGFQDRRLQPLSHPSKE